MTDLYICCKCGTVKPRMYFFRWRRVELALSKEKREVNGKEPGEKITKTFLPVCKYCMEKEHE